MVHFGFFCSSIATLDPPPLLCSTCLTFLLNIFWTIHQEYFFLSILKKFAKLKKEPWWSSFGKVVGLQHPNLLKWNPKISVLVGVTDIIFWGIFGNSYYMESLQIIDKFCSSHLMIFHDLYIVVSVVIRNWKTFHLLCNFYHLDLHTLCVYLTFIAQSSNILYPS